MTDIVDLSQFQNVPDLGKKLQEDATDLSEAAIAERKRRDQFDRAAKWARAMHRAFKGIRGAPNREQRARITIAKFGLFPEESD